MPTSTGYTAEVQVPKQFEITRVSEFMDETLRWITTDKSVSGATFDFNGVKWISAEGIVTLSTVIRSLEHSGYKTDFILPKYLTAAVNFCNDCDFFKLHFGRGIGHPARLRNTSFPIEFLSAHSFNQQYIDNLIEWLKYSCGRQYSFGALDTSLDEVFNNIMDHSGSETGGVVFAQHYPQKGYIEVAIADNGIGIARRIRGSFSGITSDEEAILYAMKPLVSTKSTPRNRGHGLDTIKTLLQEHEGMLRIVANNGFVAWNFSIQDEPVVVSSRSFAYHGTLITLRFPSNTLDVEDDSEEDLLW